MDDVAFLLGGVIITEQIFGISGMGHGFLTALLAGDAPFLLAWFAPALNFPAALPPVLRLDQGCIAETGGIALAGVIARTGFVRAAELLDT